MLRSIAASSEYICLHKTAALRCVSKHEPPHPSRRRFVPPQDEGGTTPQIQVGRRHPMHEALNHAKLAMLFRKEFELCNVRKGETIVLLSDLGARRDYVAAAFAAAEEFGADAYEMCVNAMPSWTKV